MVVGELKYLINGLSDDMEVILAVDAEGNGYSDLRCVDQDCIRNDDYDVYLTSWTASDACMEDDEWKEFLKQPRCLVLSP